MQIKLNGLVVSERKVKESNKLIYILTPDGIINCFVNCPKSNKSSKMAATQLFSYSNFVIYKGKENNVVDEVNLNEFFLGLRKDIIKLSLAQYLCDLAIALVPEYGDAMAFLRLMLNSLFYISEDKKDLALVKSIVELKMISLAGYMPNVTGCNKCGRLEKNFMYFYPRRGELYCEKCLINDRKNERNLKVSEGVLSAMHHIIYSDLEKVYAFRISDSGKKELSNLTEAYIKEQLGRTFKTLEFYHQICNFSN